jgi:hypothetical protein
MLGFWVLLDDSTTHLLHLVTGDGRTKFFIVIIAYTLFLIGSGMIGLVFMGCCTLHSKPWLITTVCRIMQVIVWYFDGNINVQVVNWSYTLFANNVSFTVKL